MKTTLLILGGGIIFYFGIKGVMMLARIGDTTETPTSRLHGE